VLSALKKLELIQSSPELLTGARRGIERECLRVTATGELAQTAHPKALGSALTHPSITTDYSEALLEFITSAHLSIDETLAELDEIHAFTTRALSESGELLWPASMPCRLGDDSEIPVAYYGTSNSAQLKTSYRYGLGHRYGRAMQTIAGIHYNYSISDKLWHALHQAENSSLSIADYKTEQYFGVIRNFRRNFWLLLYLFGASPVVCENFANQAKDEQLEKVGSCSFAKPSATSLRMGDLGYQSNAQAELVVCYNNLSQYLSTLVDAITTPHSAYDHIPLLQDGQHQQLSSSLLQIENEFYSTIRPKRTAQRGETALHALKEGGVEYIEVRCLDINPFEPRGISDEQCHFVEAFLIWCAISDSPDTFKEEYLGTADNQSRVVNHGRDPNIMLYHPEGERSLASWAKTNLDEILVIAKVLDQANNNSRYSDSVNAQFALVENSELTPSAKLLQSVEQAQDGFTDVALSLAKAHSTSWQSIELNQQQLDKFTATAEQSIARQYDIEQNDCCDFNTYLQSYLAQYKDPSLLA